MVCGAGVITFLADRWKAHAKLLALCAWGRSSRGSSWGMASGFWSAALGMVLVAMTGAALNPLIDTITMIGVKSRGIDYGRVRAAGSISFIIAAAASGFMVDLGEGIAIDLLAVIAAASTALAALILPQGSPSDLQLDRKPLSLADAMALARKPALVLFLVSAGAAQGSHAVPTSSKRLPALAIARIVQTAGAACYGRSRSSRKSLCSCSQADGFRASAASHSWHSVARPLSSAGPTFMAFDPPLQVLLPLQVAHGFLPPTAPPISAPSTSSRGQSPRSRQEPRKDYIA